MKHLLEKLQLTQTKLYESKNNCISLKQEINKLNKVFYLNILLEIVWEKIKILLKLQM